MVQRFEHGAGDGLATRGTRRCEQLRVVRVAVRLSVVLSVVRVGKRLVTVCTREAVRVVRRVQRRDVRALDGGVAGVVRMGAVKPAE